MELTGKCKKDFEVWLERDYKEVIVYAFGDEVTLASILLYEGTPISMVWGVYLDFFESANYEICILREADGSGDYTGAWDWLLVEISTDEVLTEGTETTRERAQRAAIERVNEIYNMS
jgi:hypothetical protein